MAKTADNVAAQCNLSS